MDTRYKGNYLFFLRSLYFNKLTKFPLMTLGRSNKIIVYVISIMLVFSVFISALIISSEPVIGLDERLSKQSVNTNFEPLALGPRMADNDNTMENATLITDASFISGYLFQHAPFQCPSLRTPWQSSA